MHWRAFFVITVVALALAACRSDNSNTQPTTPDKFQSTDDPATPTAGAESEASEAEEEGEAAPATAEPAGEDSKTEKADDETKPKKAPGEDPGATKE